MFCFEHAQTGAVAVCRACGRGLCRECAVEVERFLVCRNRCEESARILASMSWRTSKQQSLQLLVSLGVGSIMAIWGLFLDDLFVSVAGVLFVLFGVAHAFWIRKNLTRRK